MEKPPYHNFDKRQPRDKKGHWITRILPILRPDPPPAPLTRLPSEHQEIADSLNSANIAESYRLADSPDVPGTLTGWGCAVAILFAVAGIAGLFWFAMNTGP